MEVITGKEAAQRLAKLEHEWKLFEFVIDGWSAWRVLRGQIQRRMVAGHNFPQQPVWRRTLSTIPATICFAHQLLFSKKKSLIVKSCRSALRTQFGGKWRDVYFDGILLGGITYLKIEENNSPSFSHQAANALFPSHLDPVVFTFWGKVLGRIFPLSAARPFCEDLAGRLISDLGLRIHSTQLLAILSSVWWQARLYGWLLRRVSPEAVLVADTGEFGLRIACGRNRIRFLELQHGVFDHEHPEAVPASTPGTKFEMLLPDVYASRGRFWLDKLGKTRQGRGAVAAVGNEIIDDMRARRLSRSPTTIRNLVFTSQGIASDSCASWIEEMIGSALDRASCHFTIKLHPTYDLNTTSFDRFRGHPQVTIVSGSESPNSFQLLCDADLHISVSSACLFDAASIGVRSAILPIQSWEVVSDMIDGDIFVLLKEPADVWGLLDRAPVSEATMSYFSEPDFLRNISSAVFDEAVRDGRQIEPGRSI